MKMTCEIIHLIKVLMIYTTIHLLPY